MAVTWSYLDEGQRYMRRWIAAMRRDTEKKTPMGIYGYCISLKRVLGDMKAHLEAEGPPGMAGLYVTPKPMPVLKVLRDWEYEEILGQFNMFLQANNIEPAPFRKDFDELIDWSMPYEDNKKAVMNEAEHIIVPSQKYLPKSKALTQVERSRVARALQEAKAVSFTDVDSAINSLGWLVEVMGDAIEVGDAYGCYSVVLKMLELTVSVMRHFETLSPSIKETFKFIAPLDL